jgi:N utilization substance protein B
MSARTKARKAAVDLLFAADLRGRQASLDDLALLGRESRQYTQALIEGVSQHRNQIDSLIHTYSEGWDKDRLPAVDRNILRVGIFELLWGSLDHAVAISEAVALAELLSTDKSSKFINGLLARISGLAPTLPR